MQLLVVLVDRLAIGGAELGRRDLAAVEQAARVLGGEAEGVDHARGLLGDAGRRNPEVVAVTLGRIREDVLERQRRPGHIRPEDVHDVQGVQRRRHIGEIELRHLPDGLEDVVQLHLEPRDLVLGQLEACELRDV